MLQEMSIALKKVNPEPKTCESYKEMEKKVKKN